MRPVSFAGLHRIMHQISALGKPVSASLFDQLALSNATYRTQGGELPSRTTLFHCRNILIHLGILRREGRLLILNREMKEIQYLLDETESADRAMSPKCQELFAILAIRNLDCQKLFFDLFLPDAYGQTLADFRLAGISVVWERESNTPSRKARVIVSSTTRKQSIVLETHAEIEAVLYGIRYWARDEFEIIDEFYDAKRGVVMYPLAGICNVDCVSQIINEIRTMCVHNQDDWTIISLRDLVQQCCEQRRRPLHALFSAIKRLETEFAGYISLVPTSRSFATLSSRSLSQEDFRLRGYYRDIQGQLISHIRLHNSLGV